MTIHLVYPDGPVLTAACGQQVDGIKHTGQYLRGLAPDAHHAAGFVRCEACVHLLETP